jgi:hypothetical protein
MAVCHLEAHMKYQIIMNGRKYFGYYLHFMWTEENHEKSVSVVGLPVTTKQCTSHNSKQKLNITVPKLSLLLHAWEVLRSNLRLQTGYPDLGSSQFYTVPPGNDHDDNTSNSPTIHNIGMADDDE